MSEVGIHNTKEISKIYSILISLTKRVDKLEELKKAKEGDEHGD